MPIEPQPARRPPRLGATHGGCDTQGGGEVAHGRRPGDVALAAAAPAGGAAVGGIAGSDGAPRVGRGGRHVPQGRAGHSQGWGWRQGASRLASRHARGDCPGPGPALPAFRLAAPAGVPTAGAAAAVGVVHHRAHHRLERLARSRRPGAAQFGAGARAARGRRRLHRALLGRAAAQGARLWAVPAAARLPAVSLEQAGRAGGGGFDRVHRASARRHGLRPGLYQRAAGAAGPPAAPARQPLQGDAHCAPGHLQHAARVPRRYGRRALLQPPFRHRRRAAVWRPLRLLHRAARRGRKRLGRRRGRGLRGERDGRGGRAGARAVHAQPDGVPCGRPAVGQSDHRRL
mmetsp:Transcript_27628/g.89216  ORF Transcript_27628/g.89216 Transcript_27628/m.89216 type:complete len:344 (+) Transcript_27628:2213-3244(+)